MLITIASIMNLMGPDMMVILLIVLLLFGAKKLPELARGLGRGLRNFKEEIHGVKTDIEESDEDKPSDEKEQPEEDKPSDEKKDANE